MIRDVIERFRYRFELWRREQRDDYFGAGSSGASEESDHASRYSNPRHMVLLKESTIRSIGRSVSVYFCIIIIASQICVVAGRFFPSGRFVLAILCLVFIGLWTLTSISFHIDLYKARKQYREREAKKSANQTMQLTAGRSESDASVHESAFRPAMPRLRQR